MGDRKRETCPRILGVYSDYDAFDLAAERVVQLELAGEAPADDLVDVLGAVAVDAHPVSGASRGHFEGEVLVECVEMAVRKLAVPNWSPGHWNSLFLGSCSRHAPNIITASSILGREGNCGTET